MTIESASHPADLASWDGQSDPPFYFEVFGETSPVINTAYAEVIPAGTSDDADAQSTSPAPVYEYWWTIGHPGERTHHPLLDRLARADDLWGRLADPAAHVCFFFPMGGGWRVKEMAATVKYMSPVAAERSFMAEAAKDWESIQPFVEGASKLAGAAEPVVGRAAAGSGKVLGAVAQLKLSSVPAIKGFEWSAAKVAFNSEDHGGVAQGVMWTLPPSMFKELGGRLTGSLAVSFIPDHKQQPGEVTVQAQPPQPQDLLAHAVVRGPEGHDHWAPAQDSFVRLSIGPRL